MTFLLQVNDIKNKNIKNTNIEIKDEPIEWINKFISTKEEKTGEKHSNNIHFFRFIEPNKTGDNAQKCSITGDDKKIPNNIVQSYVYQDGNVDKIPNVITEVVLLNAIKEQYFGKPTDDEVIDKIIKNMVDMAPVLWKKEITDKDKERIRKRLNFINKLKKVNETFEEDVKTGSEIIKENESKEQTGGFLFLLIRKLLPEDKRGVFCKIIKVIGIILEVISIILAIVSLGFIIGGVASSGVGLGGIISAVAGIIAAIPTAGIGAAISGAGATGAGAAIAGLSTSGIAFLGVEIIDAIVDWATLIYWLLIPCTGIIDFFFNLFFSFIPLILTAALDLFALFLKVGIRIGGKVIKFLAKGSKLAKVSTKAVRKLLPKFVKGSFDIIDKEFGIKAAIKKAIIKSIGKYVDEAVVQGDLLAEDVGMVIRKISDELLIYFRQVFPSINLTEVDKIIRSVIGEQIKITKSRIGSDITRTSEKNVPRYEPPRYEPPRYEPKIIYNGDDEERIRREEERRIQDELLKRDEENRRQDEENRRQEFMRLEEERKRQEHRDRLLGDAKEKSRWQRDLGRREREYTYLATKKKYIGQK